MHCPVAPTHGEAQEEPLGHLHRDTRLGVPEDNPATSQGSVPEELNREHTPTPAKGGPSCLHLNTDQRVSVTKPPQARKRGLATMPIPTGRKIHDPRGIG